MPNTYTANYIHLIFVVRHRRSLIHPSWEKELYKYISGIITNRGNKLFAIGGMPDHIHIFFDLNPVCSLSDIARDLKSSSSKWINKRHFNHSKFQWQNGFASFSYAKSQLPVVARYIERQKEHHLGKSFNVEYKQFLEKFELDYNEKYILKSPVI